MKKFFRQLLHPRRLTLMGIDLAMFFCVYAVCSLPALLSSSFSVGQLGRYGLHFVICAAVLFALRFCFLIYRNVWRYASSRLYIKMIISDGVAGCVAYFVCRFLTVSKIVSINRGFWFNAAVFAFVAILTLISRFVYQMLYQGKANASDTRHKIGVAIIGAGHVGAILAQEMLYSKKSRYYPVCFVDNDSAKIGSVIHGIKVYPEDEYIIEVLSHLPVAEVVVAVPSLSSELLTKITGTYGDAGYKVSVYDFPLKDGFQRQDETAKRSLRPLSIEDLLFRRALQVAEPEKNAYYRGKTVLVTGGGGSIGSEICRQIAELGPKKLVIFDIYENNAYEIQQELVRKYGNALELAVEIGSVRDRARLNALFMAHRPQVVFHAAAHKHVPLMERSNGEAVKNNCFGTANTADMAERWGTEKFILISTDKAVNPTNIMGASKRLCEMIIQCRTDSKTAFAAVRFGNVLGSNGSVIPLFRRQIEAGGPITLTDRRIIRYFMTIPEASGLVLSAGAMAKAGELFVLDMGKPVKILELAENMIRLSGLEPYKDIDIVETGLRPGEKLYEELLMDNEELTKTDNEMIFIERDAPRTRAELEGILSALSAALEQDRDHMTSSAVFAAMHAAVPTYRDPVTVNESAASSKEMKMVKP